MHMHRKGPITVSHYYELLFQLMLEVEMVSAPHIFLFSHLLLLSQWKTEGYLQ